MYRVHLDIFSGRPNPSWILTPSDERELAERLQANPSLMLPIAAPVGDLGYRGFILELIKEEDAVSHKKRMPKLPPLFRVGGQYDREAATALWLLDTSEKPDTGVDDYLREMASLSISSPRDIPHTEKDDKLRMDEKGAGMTCVSAVYTSSTDFSIWNSSSHILKNNCYNFGANCVTDTYAQPGNKSGHPFSAYTCSNVAQACEFDGWFNSCQSSNNLTICLVIKPSGIQDFHFFRRCQNGIWCHKPGQTAAKNTDWSGNVITNPETCNRGPYTIFCGYWYANNNLMFV